MEKNEFVKGEVFSFAGSVDYASGAIVSKTVLKKIGRASCRERV